MDQSNLLVNSDYPFDKIVYMDSGSFTIPAFGFNDESIPNPLTFTPLMMGTWSLDPSFDVSYDLGTLFSSFINTGIEANPTDIIIRTNNSTSSSVTFYYRIFGFEPSNSNQTAQYTASVADDFILNTDYNYSKLFDADVISANTTVEHDQGHRVQVLVWVQNGDTITFKPHSDVDITSNNVTAEVTDSSVIFSFYSTSALIHYRIYLDR